MSVSPQSEKQQLLAEHEHAIDSYTDIDGGDRGIISDLKRNYRDYLNEGVCGMINAAIIIPVMFSFANIIFRDPIFAPYLPLLSKLVMFSGVVHQTCFLVFSTFPFAVGQVQDAGLVFLSAISTDVVLLMTSGPGKEGRHSDMEIVTTTLIVLAICTAALGICVFLVGKLNLASAVQYLPMPVLAGYLAYIGFFCGLSSFGMMADQDVATIYDVPLLFSIKSAILIFPGVVGGMLIYCSLRFVRSSLTLPVCMVVILAAFFAIMALCGMSIEDARDYGWIHPYSEPGSPLQAVELYDFTRVDWSVLLGQMTKFLAMVVVVTVSSALDIAAIEMEVGRPVDYNQELKTVGLSNLISGLCGGYTGSYIFSQTIFCLRRGVKTKVCGATILLCEFLIVIFPISITAYIPKLFFGSLLMLISLDLQWEWLIASRHKMMFSEYIVSILTFICIQFWGIESGMLIGVIAATLSFVGLYSQLEVVSVSAQRTSNAQRTFEERLMLMSKHRKVVTLTFRGYIFFGSAASLLPVLKGYMEDVVLPEAHTTLNMTDVQATAPGGGAAADSGSASLSPVYSSGSGRAKHNMRVICTDTITPTIDDGGAAVGGGGMTTPSRKVRNNMSDGDGRSHNSSYMSPERMSLLGGSGLGIRPSSGDHHSSPSHSDYGSSNQGGSSSGDYCDSSPGKILKDIAGIRSHRARSISSGFGTDLELGNELGMGPLGGHSKKTEFMVFDFTDAFGVDATACRSCFALVTSLLRGYSDITLVFTGMLPAIETLFRAHGIVLDTDLVMPCLNDGLEWCEEALLSRYMAATKRHILHTIDSGGSLEHLPGNNGNGGNNSGGINNQSYPQRAALERRHSMTVNRNDAEIVPPISSVASTGVASTEAGLGVESGTESSAVEGIGAVTAPFLVTDPVIIDSTSIAGASAPPPPEFGSGPHLERTSTDIDREAEYLRLRDIIEDYLEVHSSHTICGSSGGLGNTLVNKYLSVGTLAKYFRIAQIEMGDMVFDINEPADSVYFLDVGLVQLLRYPSLVAIPSWQKTHNAEELNQQLNDAKKQGAFHICKVTTGGIFGDNTFILSQPHSTRAVALTRCFVFVLNRDQFHDMEKKHPKLLFIMQQVLMKSLAMTSEITVQQLYPAPWKAI